MSKVISTLNVYPMAEEGCIHDRAYKYCANTSDHTFKEDALYVNGKRLSIDDAASVEVNGNFGTLCVVECEDIDTGIVEAGIKIIDIINSLSVSDVSKRNIAKIVNGLVNFDTDIELSHIPEAFTKYYNYSNKYKELEYEHAKLVSRLEDANNTDDEDFGETDSDKADYIQSLEDSIGEIEDTLDGMKDKLESNSILELTDENLIGNKEGLISYFLDKNRYNYDLREHFTVFNSKLDSTFRDLRSSVVVVSDTVDDNIETSVFISNVPLSEKVVSSEDSLITVAIINKYTVENVDNVVKAHEVDLRSCGLIGESDSVEILEKVYL